MRCCCCSSCLSVASPALAAASLAAVKLARREHWRRERLQELVRHLRVRAQRHGFELLPSDTPIQPLMCSDDATALAWSAALEQAGFLVAAIRPPTVPEGRARLRITLTAAHDPAQVDMPLDALARVRDRFGAVAIGQDDGRAA